MKSDQVASGKRIPIRSREARLGEERVKDSPKIEDDTPKTAEQNNKSQFIPIKTKINNPEEVKKLLGISIEWRDLRFYQREKGGQVFVDVVDKDSGEVIRTIPSTEFSKITSTFRHLSGNTINING